MYWVDPPEVHAAAVASWSAMGRENLLQMLQEWRLLQHGWCAAGPIARACGGYDLGVHRLDDDGLRVLCYAYEAARREAYVYMYAVQPPRLRG